MKVCVLLALSFCLTGVWSTDPYQLDLCRKRLIANISLSKTATIYLPGDEFEVDRVSLFDTYSTVQLDRGTLVGLEDEHLRNESAWIGHGDFDGYSLRHAITVGGLEVKYRAFVRHSRLPFARKAASFMGLMWTDKHTLTVTVKKLAAQVAVSVVHGDECSLTFPVWNIEAEVKLDPKINLAEERMKKFEEKLKSRIEGILKRTAEVEYRKALW